MRNRLIILLLGIALLFPAAGLHASLVINELTTNTSDDWAELFLTGPVRETREISGLYVTRYYGANEPLSSEPVTIYSYDRKETPYDDRFVVVHLSPSELPDETDRTGDTNRNGRIDLYCAANSGGLWNTEGVLAIDTDDDPANGGIIDFVYYSNRDGSPNETVGKYVAAAQAVFEWKMCGGDTVQECAVNIGAKGLASYASLSRKNSSDSNSAADWTISRMLTPGRPNITAPLFMGKRIFKPLRKKITVIPGHLLFGTGAIPLLVFFPCCIRLRVFSMNGVLVHESPPYPSVKPGLTKLYWNPLFQRRAPHTGLYLCKIEAVAPSLRYSEEETIYIIVSRYR